MRIFIRLPNKILKACAPQSLVHTLKEKNTRLKIASNLGWLFFDKVLRMGAGLFIGIWVARYLGPEQFGKFNYVIAIISIVGTFTTLGLNEIVVRELVCQPQSTNSTLGTAFVLQLLAGVLTFLGIIVSATYLQETDPISYILFLLLGASLLFRSTDTIKSWFESQVTSRYTVWVENTVFIFISGLKIYFILNKSSLIYFALILLIEALLVFMGLLLIYTKKKASIFQWEVDILKAKTLFKESWPYIVIGISNMMYARMDQIMIPYFSNEASLGLFSASVRITETWLFIPMILSSTLAPTILAAKSYSESLYIHRMKQLYKITCIISIPLAISVTLFAPKIIVLLFGIAYSGGSTVLAIRIWETVFSALSIASGKWILAENLQRWALMYSFIGLCANAIGNSILIPVYGINGAAISSVFSIIITTIIAPAFFKQTRPDVLRKVEALFLFWIPPIRHR